MDILEMLERQTRELVEKRSTMKIGSDDYLAITDQIERNMFLIKQETERRATQRKVDLEETKLEAEIETEEAKAKTESHKTAKQILIEVVKGVVFVIVNGVIIIGSIAANNNGDVIPQFGKSSIQHFKLK